MALIIFFSDIKGGMSLLVPGTARFVIRIGGDTDAKVKSESIRGSVDLLASYVSIFHQDQMHFVTATGLTSITIRHALLSMFAHLSIFSSLTTKKRIHSFLLPKRRAIDRCANLLTYS